MPFFFLLCSILFLFTPTKIIGNPVQKNFDFLEQLIVQIKDEEIQLKKDDIKKKPSWEQLMQNYSTWPVLEESDLSKDIATFLSKNQGEEKKEATQGENIVSYKEKLDGFYIQLESQLKKNSNASVLFLGLSAGYLKHKYYAQSLECLYKLYKSHPETRILYETVQHIYSYKQKGSGEAFLK